jgi:protocatechuate 4,5-dioxygenase alpha chain
MQRDVIERVLWNLSIDRFSKLKFKDDPKKFLARFALDQASVDAILNFDVKLLQEVGVNPMLTLGYWIEMSPSQDVSEYNQKLGSTADYSASIKG